MLIESQVGTTTHGRKLLLLLRHHHLPRHRPPRQLRHANHSGLRQRRMHLCRTLGRQELRTPQRPHGRRLLHDGLLFDLLLRRPLRPRHSEPGKLPRRGSRADHLFVSLHCRVRLHLGSPRLGCCRGALPGQVPGAGYGGGDGEQLVLEFHAELFYEVRHGCD